MYHVSEVTFRFCNVLKVWSIYSYLNGSFNLIYHVSPYSLPKECIGISPPRGRGWWKYWRGWKPILKFPTISTRGCKWGLVYNGRIFINVIWKKYEQLFESVLNNVTQGSFNIVIGTPLLKWLLNSQQHINCWSRIRNLYYPLGQCTKLGIPTEKDCI